MRVAALCLLLSCLLPGWAGAGGDNHVFQLYLVRHAEKQADAGRDPHLTEAGWQRAHKLAHYLQEKSVTDIWSSDYFRTRETALPLSESLGLEMIIYDPSDLGSLADELLAAANNAIVVGHSNTTPELARLLCDCDVDGMDESEYGRLIIVSFDGEDVQLETLQQENIFKYLSQ
jgi:phosphohistidine phosphatase SixA